MFGERKMFDESVVLGAEQESCPEGIRGIGLEFVPGKTFYNSHSSSIYIDGNFYLDGVLITQKQAFQKFPLRAAWLSKQLFSVVMLTISNLIAPEGRDIQHIEDTITWIIESDNRFSKFQEYNSDIGEKLGTLRSFFTEISQDITQFPTENAYSSVYRVGGDYFIETIIGGIEQERISLSHEEIDIILCFRSENNTKLGER